MGIGGISIWQLLIVLVIVLLLFGTKKLKNIGSDLGGAVKGFRSAMTDSEKAKAKEEEEARQLEDTKAERTAEAEQDPKAAKADDKTKA